MKIQYEQKTIKHRWVLTAACGWAWPERVAPTRSPRTEPVKQVLVRFANRVLLVLVAADTTPVPSSRAEVCGGEVVVRHLRYLGMAGSRRRGVDRL